MKRMRRYMDHEEPATMGNHKLLAGYTYILTAHKGFWGGFLKAEV